MTLEVRAMTAADWPAVKSIFEEGIATGDATFETKAPTWEAWDEAHLAAGRLVGLVGGEVAGWAALAPVSDRCVYGGVAEVSVYVGAAWRGRGVGLGLLRALVAGSEGAGFWTLRAGIFPENAASLAIHERAGFRVVGRFERLGRFRDGRWRDVLLLERRSAVVGVEGAT